MDDKITIIEGPPPTFEAVNDGWALGLNESPTLFDVALTRLRTFNGPALVERCYRTWGKKGSIFLEYRNAEGLEDHLPILAARSVETSEGQILLLWVRLPAEEAEVEYGFDDFSDDSDDDLN